MTIPVGDSCEDSCSRALAGRIWSSCELLDDFLELCAIGGRFAGTESETLAREFLRGRLLQATGAKVLSHRVHYDGWRRRSSQLLRRRPNNLEIPAHALVWSPGTPPAGLECEVVDLGRGTLEDFQAQESSIPGRLALVRHEYMFASGHVHRRQKYRWAKERGAAGFLIGNMLPGQVLVTGSSGRGEASDIPAAGITREGALALERSGTMSAVASLELIVERAPATAENLVVEIPGLDTEWVVLCAHYDGHDLGQSAVDNGSGVAVALEVARAIAPLVPSLRRGLRIVLFTIEEWGLAGSRHYVNELSEGACEEIALVVNLDSVAGGAQLTALTTGFEELDAFLPPIAERRGIRLRTFNPVTANSDHASFARRGIPSFRLLAGFDDPESRLRHLLTPGDTSDKVSPVELKLAALLTAEIVLHACTAPGPIARRRSAEEVNRMFAHVL